MSALQIITSVLSLAAVLLGAVATYRSSRTQQKKNEDDRYENYTTRIEKRLTDVEGKLHAAEQEIETLKDLRSKDTRWKRIATRYIEDLHRYIEDNLGSSRKDVPAPPVPPEELKLGSEMEE